MRIACIAALAALTLAGCTHYHTTEYRTRPAATNTVIVPQVAPTTVVQERSPDMVLPKDTGPESETVTVAPDSTVTVTRPN